MEFSQTFDLGNSTLLNIESAEKIRDQLTRKSNETKSIKNDENILEVIDESPTNKKACNLTLKERCRTRSILTQKIQNKRKSLKRNKSEPIVAGKENLGVYSNCENYSDFFKSDFNISDSTELNSIQQETNTKNHNSIDIVKKNLIPGKKLKENINFCEEEIEDLFNESLNLDSKISPDKKTTLNVTNANELEQAIYIENSDLEENSLNEIIWKSSSEFDESIYETKNNKEQNDETINTEEISFVFINDVSINTTKDKQNEILLKELKKCKKEVSKVLKTEIQPKTTDPKTRNSIENVTINFSTSEQKLLNWSSVTSEDLDNQNKSIVKEKTIIKETENYLQGFKSMSAWNFPNTLLKEYEKKGIINMFDWQVKCLSNPKILFDHSNLVYSAPTSSGKTLVSEILIIKTILERKKKVILILPFISVVREKMYYLQDLLTSSGYRVEGFFGGYTPPGGFDSINLAICTIEKANSIINKLLEQNKLNEIGTIVVDEIHLISDPGRGYIIELLLAKILYMCRKYSIQIQIITMSATIANIELLEKWLNAEKFSTNFRPIDLYEMIKINKKIYNNKMNFIRELNDNTIKIDNDPDDVAQLCIETILENCSVIVFCQSKDWCEKLCLHLSFSIYKLLKTDLFNEKLSKQIQKNALNELKIEMKNCPTGLDSILEKTISFGCAFHHAGLTTEERDIIELNFRNGLLKVIVATSTLSSGVNLPARRVIIRSPLFGGKKMNSLTYKQMIGRAGRTGKDTLGESILICNEANSRIGKELVCDDIIPISSCLNMDNSIHLKRALLEVISSGIASTKNDIDLFVECTLLHIEKSLNLEGKPEKITIEKQENDETIEPIKNSIEFLIEYEFIRLQMNDETKEMNYIPTRLGMACLSSSLPPNDGLLLFAELQKSRRCFVLDSELHAVYLVTPYSVCYQLQELDWLLYLDMWEKLSASMKRVGDIVGVKESFLVRAMRGQSKLDYRSLQIHKRFYTALALQELINEKPINIIASKYKCSRGLLQSLQQMASTFAGIVSSFCNSLNWTMLSLIVSQFKERLYFGIHHDLIDLMRIPELNSQRARALFQSGIKTLIDLANSEGFLIEKVLFNSISFDLEKKHEDENDTDAYKRVMIRNLFVTGKTGLTVHDAAKLLIKEAREFIQHEIGVTNVKWENSKIIQNEIVSSKTIKIQQEIKSKISDNNKRKSPDKIDEIIQENLPEKMIKSNLKNSSIDKRFNTKPNKNLKTNQIKEILENSCMIANSQIMKTMENKIHENPKNEEIISQEKVLDKSNSYKITEKVRLLRSKRLQRTQKLKTQPNLIKTQISEKSEIDEKLNSIEISDISVTNSLFQNPKEINSSHILNISKTETNSILFNSINIINICGNQLLFEKSIAEISKSSEIGFSLGIQKILNKKLPIIGGNLLLNQIQEEFNENENYNFTFDEIFYISGISISINFDNLIYFLDLQNENSDKLITNEIKMNFIQDLFGNKNLIIKIYDSKEQLKILKKVFLNFQNILAKIHDPKIANWLLQPDIEMNFLQLVQQYAPECSALITIAGSFQSNSSIGLNYNSSIIGKIRSSVESCVTLHILKNQLENLERIGNGALKRFFEEIEMPIQISLSLMETIGFPVDEIKLGNVAQEILDFMKKLEHKIYELHGKKFSLSSSSAVARVLGLHKKSNGRFSTTKEILEKIDSPISNLIVDYRKLSATLNKTIQPLLKCIIHNRIHSNSITLTSTGRISMHEPNLQNVAKNFEIEFLGLEKRLISCRNAFEPENGKCLLSGDFCQLEMRILTHLSQDTILSDIMKTENDIFTAISAKWNKIPEFEVSQKLRDGTKQLCYAIIYGMGMKSLADALKCTEHEAIELSEQFHLAYPGIREYTNKIVKFARQKGYVETITGRRRYLAHINSPDITLKNQAERQAINSTIQGSAADIAKNAILQMEKNTPKYQNKLKINIENDKKSFVHFVLHLHDELIFEVPSNKMKLIAKLLKSSMENCVRLNVPLKVKLKSGKSWGNLQELIF